MGILPKRVRRVVVYAHPVNMSLSFDSLGLKASKARADLTQGDLVVFTNANRTLCKCLLFDESGEVIYYKRLATGQYNKLDSKTVSEGELASFLGGAVPARRLERSSAQV